MLKDHRKKNFEKVNCFQKELWEKLHKPFAPRVKLASVELYAQQKK